MARLPVAWTKDLDLPLLYRAHEADPLLLLIGMVLDQQQSIERAFTAPFDLLTRMGRAHTPGGLRASELVTMDLAELTRLFSIVPALHRFPASMAKRTQELCAHISEVYDDRPDDLWRTASTAKELCARTKKLPGFGDRKAKVFTALVAKRMGIELPGWREVSGEFGEDGVLRSVADLDGPDALVRYRVLKAAAKVASESLALADPPADPPAARPKRGQGTAQHKHGTATPAK